MSQPLPISCAQPAMAATSTPRVLAATGPSQRSPLAAGMRRFDARIAFVDDCEQALGQVLASEFELVLLDADVPGMPAAEACALIRQQEPMLPVIALAGDPDARVPIGPSAFTDVLRKPLDSERIVPLLGRHLRERPITVDPAQAELDDALAGLRHAFITGIRARYLDEMQRQLHDGDFDALRRSAHRLAGSAACHQLSALASAAAGLEQGMLIAATTDIATRRFEQVLHAAAALLQAQEHSA